MSAPRMKPGTRKLSDVTRLLGVPKGIVSTGWPAVRQTCATKLGISFDDWQDAAGRLILAKRADGTLAAMVDGVGMSVPRQVGKTYLIGAMVFALCVNTPGLLVIWTAHHARTHGETFLAMQGFAERSKVKPYIRQVFTGSGDEEVRFRNGSRILFGARERGFGRGIPGVDVLVFDEAQILSDKALAAMLATMNVSSFGLSLFIGTPPRPDDMSEAFTRMRLEAQAKTLTDGAWIEIGAERGANPEDRRTWARANPSFPTRTPAQSMLRLKRKLTPEDFLREGLGIWDENTGPSIFGASNWDACAVARRPDGARVGALAVAAAFDGSWACVAAAALSGGAVHVKPLEHHHGLGWVVEATARAQAQHGAEVAIDERGPASSLIKPLLAAGVRLRILDTTEVLDAYAWLHAAVTEEPRGLTHGNYPELDRAVPLAAERFVGERKALGRRASKADISPVEGAMLAGWLASQGPDSTPPAAPIREASATRASAHVLATAGF